MRVSLNLDDRLSVMAENHAMSLGLSIDEYFKSIVTREAQTFQAKLDKMIEEAENDNYEPFSIEQLREDIKNAK